MEPEKTPRERVVAFISRLVPHGRPTEEQVLWAVRVVVALAVLLALMLLIGAWLWAVVADYVHPKTPSDRKDLVNVFVVIGAGVIGLLTATAALGNLYISRRNLQQQRDLEAERAQDDALQAYYKQIGDLLTEHDLKNTQPDNDVALLARAQTLAVVRRLAAERKSDLILFLYGAGLITMGGTIVDIGGADLRGAVLRGADLRGANLGQANLFSAELRGADLSGAELRGADLSGADLSGADLSRAYLGRAELIRAYLGRAELSEAELEEIYLKGVEVQFSAAKSLEGTTMPDGQLLRGNGNPDGPTFDKWLKDKWLKDREGRKEDAEND